MKDILVNKSQRFLSRRIASLSSPCYSLSLLAGRDSSYSLHSIRLTVNHTVQWMNERGMNELHCMNEQMSDWPSEWMNESMMNEPQSQSKPFRHNISPSLVFKAWASQEWEWSQNLFWWFFFNEKKNGFDDPTFSTMKPKKKKINCQIAKLKRSLYFFILNVMFLVKGLGKILVLPALACSDREATLGCFWSVLRMWSTPLRHCACSFSSHCRSLRFITKKIKAKATENTQGGMDWSTS